MDKKEILEVIERFKEREKMTRSAVEKFCKDKSIPVDDRWEVFIKSGFGDHDCYYEEPDGIDWGTHTLTDDFYCERYETMQVDYMLTLAKERNLLEEGGEEAFKEYFLQKFIRSFENDW